MGLSEHVLWKPPLVCCSFVKPVFLPFITHSNPQQSFTCNKLSWQFANWWLLRINLYDLRTFLYSHAFLSLKIVCLRTYQIVRIHVKAPPSCVFFMKLCCHFPPLFTLLFLSLTILLLRTCSPSSTQTSRQGSAETEPSQSYTRSFIKKNMLKNNHRKI